MPANDITAVIDDRRRGLAVTLGSWGDKFPAQTARFSVTAFIREAHFDEHRYITLILWLNCWKIRQISIGYAIDSV